MIARFFRMYGGWVLIVLVFAVLGIAGIAVAHHNMLAGRSKHVQDIANLQSLKPGDLIFIGNDWEIVRTNDANKSGIISLNIRNSQNFDRDMEQLRLVVDKIVRQSDTNAYNEVCINFVKGLIR